MKVVIFAGGVGTRLWPLSRKNTPKQFEKIIGEQSTIQIAVQKLFPAFEWKDIYISTNKQYEQILNEQFPQLPKENIILEPQVRDVGPAVGLAIAHFIKKTPDEPIAVLWGDHLVRKEEEFRKALQAAEDLVKKDPQKMVFIGQKPRFSSQNLGYIEFGNKISQESSLPVYEFTGFTYRPHLSVAEQFVKDGHHAWNLGYFVTTPRFLWNLFEKFAPNLAWKLGQISAALGTEDYEKVLNEVYPTIEKISFDNAVLEKMDKKDGLVLSVDIGWSDIGAWEALKEALASSEEENVIRGNVMVEDSRDSLVFNYNEQALPSGNKQMIVGIDLDGMLVVSTEDVLLVCPKTSVPKIKKFVESLANTPNGKLT